MSEKLWALLAIVAALALCFCAQQDVESAHEVSAMPQIEEMRQPMGEEETGTETPGMQPLEPAPGEQAPEKPGVPQKVPGFEAYLTLGAIELAGVAVALAHRKKE